MKHPVHPSRLSAAFKHCSEAWPVLLALLALLVLWTQPAWAQDKTYLVRFKESAVPQVRPGSVRDDRIAQNPERWQHVGERAVAHVQTLEKRHKIKADAAFGNVFKGMTARLNPSQREALRRDPSVELIEEEQTYSVQPLGKTSTTLVSKVQTIPWGVSKTLATQSYALVGDGSGALKGVRAYIIDTGLDTRNADLMVMSHLNFSGDGRNIDCNGHGTHVAGTVAAADNSQSVVGMGPGVALYGVKVLNCQGSGTTTSVIQGLDWVAANAIVPAVANLSLGGAASQMLDDAVRKVASKGVFVSIAAGNSGANACNSSPARLGGSGNTSGLGLLTVAASDSADLEAAFSNFGSCVDIWAPGVNIASLKLGGGVIAMSGTSMASPHVGGAAALYLARYPSASAASVANTLKGMASTPGSQSKDGRSITRLLANVQ